MRHCFVPPWTRTAPSVPCRRRPKPPIQPFPRFRLSPSVDDHWPTVADCGGQARRTPSGRKGRAVQRPPATRRTEQAGHPGVLRPPLRWMPRCLSRPAGEVGPTPGPGRRRDGGVAPPPQRSFFGGSQAGRNLCGCSLGAEPEPKPEPATPTVTDPAPVPATPPVRVRGNTSFVDLDGVGQPGRERTFTTRLRPLATT
jgi:hypothetical protein